MKAFYTIKGPGIFTAVQAESEAEAILRFMRDNLSRYIRQSDHVPSPREYEGLICQLEQLLSTARITCSADHL